MKSIKFSHDYEKLPENWQGTDAILTGLVPAKISQLKQIAPEFLEYDTKFRGEEGNYPLGFEDALILFFIHVNTGKPFSTIRRNYKSKYEYYANSVFQYFRLEYTSPLHNSVIEEKHNDIGEAVSV